MQPNGQIKKVKGDFAVRKGVTKEPVADIDFVGNDSFPPSFSNTCGYLRLCDAWTGISVISESKF